MKVVKFLLGLVAAMTLLVGGYTAGSFITQTRAASVPMLQSAQPTFIPQQQFQPTIVPRQPQATPAPQTTSPAIPPQGQWGRGWWMTLAPDASAGVDPNYVPQGEWERGWIMYPDFSSQGQRGWGMHDWGYDNCDGFYGGRGNGYGSQTNPNWNSTPTVPNTSPSYPVPSATVSFKDNVQPIFAARCVACHGGTNGLYLDTYENILKGGVNGAVVIPGDVYNSRLAYYVYSGYMPFRSTPLTPAEIQTILDWIALGAPNN